MTKISVKNFKLKYIKTLLGGIALTACLEAGASQPANIGFFEAELPSNLQQAFEHKLLCGEVAADFNEVVSNSLAKGDVLRHKFDASYGAGDCQTQALLMMSILSTYQDTKFNDLPKAVQTTLKAMHVLTKFYDNKRDKFGLFVYEDKGIRKIVYCEKNGSAVYKITEAGVSEGEFIKSLGTCLSQTAIANLKKHSRAELLEEFMHPKFHPKNSLPQSLTTLGLLVMFDYIKANKIPLLLKVTRILGIGMTGDGSGKKGIFKGQGQDLVLLLPSEGDGLKSVPKEEWDKYMHTPAFAIRLFSVKSHFKDEHFEGYAQRLHEADTFEQYLSVLGEPGFVPFVLALNAIIDDKGHDRKPFCAAVAVYFDASVISYKPTWTKRDCSEGSIPMETPHVYVSTLFQQKNSLKDVTNIVMHKKLIEEGA